jgi:hypothetical protein
MFESIHSKHISRIFETSPRKLFNQLFLVHIDWAFLVLFRIVMLSLYFC